MYYIYNTSYWSKLQNQILVRSEIYSLLKQIAMESNGGSLLGTNLKTTTFEFYRVNKEQHVASGEDLWCSQEHVQMAI